MRVLFFTSSFPRNRNDVSSAFVKRLAEEIASDPSFQVSVFAPQVADRPFEKQFGSVRVHRFRYWFPRRRQLLTTDSIRDQISRRPWLVVQVPFFLIAELYALIQLMRKEPVDIIHAHWLFPQGFIAALYKRLINPSIAIVCTVHGSDINALRGSFFYMLHRWTLKVIDTMVVVSPALAHNRLFVGMPQPQVISMGFDSMNAHYEEVQAIQKSFAPGPIILFVARLAPIKNLGIVLEAMNVVWKSQPSASLLIVGDGPFRETYEQLACATSRPAQIHFLGSMPMHELAAYYAAVDIFVAASSAEGFGLTFLEALSAGLPIVTTAVGIIPEISSNAIFTFTLEDGPVKLAETIQRALQRPRGLEPQMRAQLEERYGWPVVARRYAEIYRNVRMRPHRIRDDEYWKRRTMNPTIASFGLRSYGDAANQLRYHVVCSALVRLLDRLLTNHRASVLDAGAGDGIVARIVYEAGFTQLTVADISQEALSQVGLPVRTIVSSLETLHSHVHDVYDIVYCFDVLYHITEDAAFRMAIANLCAVSGQYVLVHGYFPRFFPLWIVRHARFRTLRKYDRIFAENRFRRISRDPTFFIMLRLPFYRFFGWFPNFCYAIDRALLRAATILGISGASSHFIVVYERSQAA